MYITTFNQNFYDIDRAVELTHFNLKYDRQFPDPIRKQFNEALKKLSNLLFLDNFYRDKGPTWHVAHRIVCFQELALKIERIRENILIHCSIPYFTTKIKKAVLPALTDRINQLKFIIGLKGRLPFSKGRDREVYHDEVKLNLQLQNAQHIIHVQKEFFHFLGDHLDEQKIKGMDIQAYNGNFEIYSLESWAHVLNVFIEEGDEAEKKIGQKLLSMIQKAIPLALKTSYACQLPQTYQSIREDSRQELAYLEDLAKLQGYLDSDQKPSIEFTQFLERYQLADNCPVPKLAIINEMAWDMHTAVHQLQEGESLLFALGTRTHSIAVQVTCIQASSSTEPGNYQETIFNTGEKVEDNHRLAETGEFAHPIIYRDLPLKAFTYSFLSQLLILLLESRDVNAFYELHDLILVEKFGGKKDYRSGALYPLQKFGTCTYSAIEAWIDSYLNKQQNIHLKVTKAQVSTRKQAEVIKILQQDARTSNWRQVKGRGKSVVSPLFITKTEEVKKSQIFLEMGQNFLQQITKESML